MGKDSGCGAGFTLFIILFILLIIIGAAYIY
ncbi:YjcZ family sporulation protein [Sutcliffiella horikoshii]